MNNVLCIGELLIDFICSDLNTDISKGENFKKKAGGAPANVTAAISKLGGKSSFVGKVGKDPFGVFLKKTLDDLHVDTSMLIMDKKCYTTLAFVSLKSDGERDFVFNRGADELLKYSELDLESIFSNKILHFGSATALLGGEMRQTYTKIMKEAREKGIFISFDPNFRNNLWNEREEEFVNISRQCIDEADFVKLSDEELKIISGKENILEGVDSLIGNGSKIIAVTLGKQGTLVSNGEQTEIVKSINVKSIDSTGAGDAFIGAVLFKISLMDDPKEQIKDFDNVKEIVSFANKVGALVCTKLGAISALPTIEEVENKNLKWL